MAGRVARDVDHFETQAEGFGMVALRERREGLGNALARGAEHRCARGRMERGDAARVIGVVVRD
jgi:hypothetical protein